MHVGRRENRKSHLILDCSVFQIWLWGWMTAVNPPPLLINLKNSWLPRVFAAAGGLALVVASRGYASPRCAGSSSRRLLWSWSTGSRVWAQHLWCTGFVAHGMQELSRPKMKPMSPALAGRFLTTRPPTTGF